MAETITPSNTAAVVASGDGDDDGEYLTLDEWVEFFKFKRGRDSPSEARNALLVIAVLITTATYQAALNPPGGLWQDTKAKEIGVDGHQAGKTILATKTVDFSFLVFIVTNTAGFFGSIFIIAILTEGFPLRLELWFTILALIISYDFAMISIIPQGNFAVAFTLSSIFFPLGIGYVAKRFRKAWILRRQGRNICDICNIC